MARVAIQEKFLLPSNGRLYTNLNIPKEINLRAMSTLDEKIRLASNNPFKTTPALIKNCLVGSDFDTEDLKLFDLYFLMFKLREITYGSDYKVDITCRSCKNKQKVNVDLSSLEVNMLDDNDAEPFIIELPKSKDRLACRYLSCKDLNELQNEVKRIQMKNPDINESDVSFIPGLCTRVVSINDEVLPKHKMIQYMQEMHAMDYNYFDKKYIEITNKPGINLNYIETCEHCGTPMVFEVPILGEFFSPSID